MNQCYSTVLFGKQRKIYGLGVRVGRPKRLEERPEAQFWLLFLFFLLSLSLPSVNRASQEGCLFQLRFSLQSSDLPLFYFCRRFPSLSFSHHFQSFLNSFFLFYLPNISPPPPRDGRPKSLGRGSSRSLWILPTELGWRGALDLPLQLVSSLRVLIAVSI